MSPADQENFPSASAIVTLVPLPSMEAERVVTLNNLAGILLSMENYEEAERLIREAISYEEPLGESAALAIRYGMASDILLKRGKPEEALEYATRALDIDTRAGRTEQIAVRQSQLAEAYLQTGRLREAGELLDRAAAVFSESGNLLLQRNISQDLAALLEDSDPRAAIRYMQDVVALSDSLYQQQAAQKIAELTIRNDLAGKEREIENQQRLLRSQRTVETHKHNIFRKLGINKTIELVRLMNSRKRM